MSVPVRTRRAVAVLAAAAIAGWAAPAGASVEDVVAAGPDGTASFAFTKDAGGFRQVKERSWSATTALGFTQVVSWGDFDAGGQRIGVDASGNALIAWLGSDGEEGAVWVRRRTPDGGLSAIQRLTPAGADPAHLEMAVEPDGDATVVWTRNFPSGKRVVQSRKRSAGGTLGAAKTLSGTLGFAQNAQVAVTPGGAATVAWLRADSEAIKYVQTRTVAPDGTLSPIQTLTPTNSPAGAPLVTVGDQGTAVFAWYRNGFLQSRARSSTGALSATQTVSGENAVQEAMAGDRSGRAAFTWVADIDDKILVLGRIRNPNGALGPTFELGSGGRPRVALDPSGHATYVWVGTPDGTDVIQARRRSVTATLGPVREVGEAPSSAWDPRVVVDAAGTATIAFALFGDRNGLHARSLTPSGTLSPLRDIDGP